LLLLYISSFKTDNQLKDGTHIKTYKILKSTILYNNTPEANGSENSSNTAVNKSFN